MLVKDNLKLLNAWLGKMARYALVIGVAAYNNFGNLEKAVTDAEAIARLLEKQGNFQEVKRLPAKWLKDESRWVIAGDKKLTGKELGNELRTFLLEQAAKHEAVIYFAGHGLAVSSCMGVEEGYLATSDCSEDGRNAIPLRHFNALMAESDLSSLVVMLDCCYAGTLLERQLLEPTFTAFNTKRDYYLITACRGFQKAYEGVEHGVFTQAILKGLAAENADEKGQVSGDRLFDYIASELKGSRQEPIRMGWGRSIALVQYQPKKTEIVIDETCPYQGLEAFGKEQARFFFGREKVIQLLMERLGQTNFVPIIGASGNGKSSVVKAGLIPSLEKNGWRILRTILPGDEPLAELKTVLIELFGRTEGREVYSLVKTEGLRPVIERLSGCERLLLVIDQFEEVFTVCPKQEERRRFIELLTQVAEIPASRLAIVTTMRADFLEPCLSYESLTRLIQNEVVYMPPLEGAELEEAIASPAKLQGYRFQKGLLGAILQDVGNEQGCLPLLQFALTELWEQRDRQTHQLTLAEYKQKQIGGVIGALNRHAEQLYQSFTEEEQVWIKRIFLKLVRTGAEEKDTRQRQPKEKLLTMTGDYSANWQALSNILARLVQGRLLVTDNESTREAGVDLAHEALIEGWKRFAEWRKEDRELRRLIDRVGDSRREWLRNQKDENYLMMGGLLTQVRQKWQELESDLDAASREFYKKSDASELLQGLDKYRTFAENATEGIFQITAEGRYLTVNPALARILGYESPEELMTKVTNIIQQLYVEPTMREDLNTLVQRYDIVSDVQSQVYCQDGTKIWISENIRAVRDAAGTLLYYEGTVVDITERRHTESALRYARKQSQLLLLSTLPQAIAERLIKGQRTIAESFDEVTVMFADLVDFTKFSAQTSPTKLVETLHEIFSRFDKLAEQHQVEKIKTIGDAYMVVAGLPTPRADHAQSIAQMALDMQKAIAQYNIDTNQTFKIRIGINSGPVVAGVIGITKFSYDLWGDTVNIAFHMESQSIPGCIQVTATTYEQLKEQYVFEARGLIQIKNKGEMDTYFLTNRR